MSDDQVAYEYIAKLQRQAFASQGREAAGQTGAEQAFAEMREREGFGDPSLPPAATSDPEFKKLVLEYPLGPFEPYSDHQIVLQLYFELIKGPVRSNVAVPELPPFGNLPIGSTNAKVVKLKENGQIVLLFQSGIFYLLHLLGKALAYAFPVVDEGHGRFSFDLTAAPPTQRSYAYLRFEDLMDAVVFDGNPRRAVPYLIPPRWEQLASLFRRSAEQFVLYHELGHIAAGHLSQAEQGEVIHDWEKEFEADALGLKFLTLTYDDGRSGAPGVQAAYKLFFRAIDLIERAKTFLREGPDTQTRYPESHPPPFSRIERLDSVASSYLTEDAVKQSGAMGSLVETLMDRMWDLYYPHLVERKAAGAKLSPAWDPAQAQAPQEPDWIGLLPFESCRRQVEGLRYGEQHVRAFNSKHILGYYREFAVSMMSSAWSSDAEVAQFCRESLTWLYPQFPLVEDYLRDYANVDVGLRMQIERYESIHREVSGALAGHAVDAVAGILDYVARRTEPTYDAWFLFPFFDQYELSSDNLDEVASLAQIYLAFRGLDDPNRSDSLLANIEPVQVVTRFGSALGSRNQVMYSMARVFFDSLAPGEVDTLQKDGHPESAFYRLLDIAATNLTRKLSASGRS